jgi:Putative metallopeptidase
MERFQNDLCLGYGNNPDRFKDLADKFLKVRAPRCKDEYRQVEKAFVKTILAYVDPSLLQEVRARRCFAPSMYEWR